MNAPICPDCKVEMEPGFVPELGHYNSVSVSCWTPGPPKWKTGLLGTRLEYTGYKRLFVESFRCPQCGLLREYALHKPKM